MVLDNDFQLGEWRVKPHTNMIEGPEGETHLEPKAMQVLALLAQRAGGVVQKQEILDDVWDGTYVSDEVLPNAIWELRKALGDDARKPRFIQTLPKKGYRLIVPVDLRVDAPLSEENASLRASFPWVLSAATVVVAMLFGLVVFFLNETATDGRPPRGTADDPYSVLIMSFDNHTNVEDLDWLSTGAPTMLRTGLAEISGIQVVSTARLEQVLADSRDDVGQQSVAHRTGADTVVRGSIFKFGNDYRIDVQIEDVTDAQIFAAYTVRGDDVFRLMDDLTARVRDSLVVEGGDNGVPVRPIAEMTTTSLDAFRLYNAGVIARRNLRLADAQRLLTRAVEIDATFALAYLELSWVALASKDEAAYDALSEKTLEHRKHLPPHRHRLLEAAELWKQDPAEAERILLDVVERRPDEEEAYMQLAYLYKRSFEPSKARDILKRGATALPHSGYLRLCYGYQLLWEGRYPEAIHEFEVYARIRPDEANPRDSLGEAYLIAGIPERALEEYEGALQIDDNFASSHLGRSWAFSQMGHFEKALAELDAIQGDLPPGYSEAELQFMKSYFLSRAGRYQDADILLQQVSARANELQDQTLSGMTHLFESLIELEKGVPTLALAAAERAAEVLPTDGRGSRSHRGMTELLLGIAATRTGDLNRAHKHLLALQEYHQPKNSRERWWYHLLLGETLLARGDAHGAYTAFTDGAPRQKMIFNVTHLFENLSGALSFRDGAARAKALAGDRREAIALYEKLVRPDIGQKWTAPLEPRYHMELARLHRELGDREQASRHYRRVLSLWSKADPRLPELAEAEAYLAKS